MTFLNMRNSNSKPKCPACEQLKQPLQDMPNRTPEEMRGRIHFLEKELEKRKAECQDLKSDNKHVHYPTVQPAGILLPLYQTCATLA